MACKMDRCYKLKFVIIAQTQTTLTLDPDVLLSRGFLEPFNSASHI